MTTTPPGQSRLPPRRLSAGSSPRCKTKGASRRERTRVAFIESYDDDYVADLEDDIAPPYQGWNEPESVEDAEDAEDD